MFDARFDWEMLKLEVLKVIVLSCGCILSDTTEERSEILIRDGQFQKKRQGYQISTTLRSGPEERAQPHSKRGTRCSQDRSPRKEYSIKYVLSLGVTEDRFVGLQRIDS